MASSRADWPARVDWVREQAVRSLVIAGALAIPLVFLRDPHDMFRMPKAIALRAEAILLVVAALAAILLGGSIPRVRWRDPFIALPLIALAITALLTLTSTNTLLSVSALGSAVATAVVFFATVFAARAGWIVIVVPFAAAMLNALLMIAEETKLWMPFGVRPDALHHLQCDALIGNPNEVGSFLGAAALACLAMIVASEQRFSARNVIMTTVIGAGLIASQTLTAFIAFTAAAFAMFALKSWKNALRAGIAAIVIGVALVALYAPLRLRATRVAAWWKAGDYNSLSTDRLTPFLSASSMFADHPLTGVGPGAFSWHYYDYKLRAEQRHPFLRQAYNRGVNFGEVHNDHLQVLAEGGAIGYAAFLALLGALAWLSFRVPADAPDARQRFTHHLALPLVVFWLVLSIAQFPLETTVVRMLLVHLAAVCVGWRE
jgi:uncharacterized membrane protein